MIKCNHCGKMNAVDAGNCYSCGVPLSSKAEGWQKRGQEQPELPTWLESLRVGERPAGPASNAAAFSTADFVEEGTLPSWMRVERNEARDVTGPNTPVTARPSSFPAPTTDAGTFSSSGMDAQSLIDEQALPPWMQEGQAATPPFAQEGMAASSLIQQDNIPDWMKTLQQSQSRPTVSPARTEQPAKPAQQGGPGASGFSARDLVDQQALPSWMTQQSGQGPAPTVREAQAEQASQAQGAGFSARDLIDQQALPSWMTQQSSQTSAAAATKEQTNQAMQAGPAGQAGQANFSASSLLDVNSLPSWLREGVQEGRNSAQPPASPGAAGQSWQAAASSSPTWSPQTPPANAVSEGSGNPAASSFIDMNSLPQWLRSSAEQQSSPGAASYDRQENAAQPGSYPVPPRVENMRVPSRPRTEANPPESSEVAANVFASMLGVASATPNYPAPSYTPASYQQVERPGEMGQQGGMGQPLQQMPAGMGYPGQQGGMGQPGMQQMGGMPNTPPGIASGYNQAGPGGSMGGYSSGNQVNPPGTPSLGVAQYPSNAGYANNTPASSAGRTPLYPSDQLPGEAKGAKKRSLFGALLDWISSR